VDDGEHKAVFIPLTTEKNGTNICHLQPLYHWGVQCRGRWTAQLQEGCINLCDIDFSAAGYRWVLFSRKQLSAVSPLYNQPACSLMFSLPCWYECRCQTARTSKGHLARQIGFKVAFGSGLCLDEQSSVLLWRALQPGILWMLFCCTVETLFWLLLGFLFDLFL
jgi:hypothetical protein